MKLNSNTAAKRTIITKGAIFLVWLTIAALAGSTSAGTYSGGSGTAEYPYLISTADALHLDGGRPYGIVGRVTSAVLIPEPATILLLSVGVLVLRKRQR